MKKIIAFFVAVFVFISFLAVCFSVSADNETGMTNQEYYAAQAYLVAKYKDGKISYSEFQQQSQAVTDEFVSKNTVGGVLQSGALNASNTFNAVSQKIGNTVQKYGESAREHIDSYISDFFDSYTVMSDRPITDLNGYGALYERYNTKGEITHRFYCDYVVLNNSVVMSHGTVRKVFYDFRGNITKEEIVDYDSIGSFASVSISPLDKYYGDVRYEDGTQAPTDDEYETVSDYDFSEAPERELEDLLKKILDEFELQQPDLSSIEGLLNAIYARLGTLDSDNDNALLASINAAILALVKSNNDNNEALLNELVGFREDLKNGTVGTGSAAHGHEISGTLYNVIPLDENWVDSIFHDRGDLKVQYKNKIYYLEDCGCLILDGKYYTPNMNYDSYAIPDYDFSNSDNDIDYIVELADKNQSIFDVDFGSINDFFPSQNTGKRKISARSSDSEQSFFDNLFSKSQEKKVNKAVELITDFVRLGVPFELIRDNFSVYEEIIFNDYLPKDLTFTVFDTNVVLLRYSDFITDKGNETTSYTEPIAIVRAFSSIVISFYWVFSMYKKVSSLI